MKKLFVLALLLIGTSAHATAQPAEAVSSKRLNFAYTFGNPDYVDLSSLGPNVFAAGVDNQMVKARNLKSFAINYRGWRLLDEFIVDPEFFWELDPIALKGKIRTVNYEKIAKYPSLAKRYKAIKPTGVNFVVCVNISWIAEFESIAAARAASDDVCFRAQSYQMFWGASRSGRPATYPGALLGWYEGISLSGPNGFNEIAKSQVPTMKQIVSKFSRVGPSSGKTSASRANTYLDVRWPDDAIDKIYDDFEEYEKEGKDLEKEYKEAKEEPKVAKRAQALTADDEMAQPYESDVKTALSFNENSGVGLKTPSGRTIFSSNEYQYAYSLDKAGSLFEFTLKSPSGDETQKAAHLIKASGRRMKVKTYDEFWDIVRNEDLQAWDKFHPKKGLVPAGSYSLLVDLPGGTTHTSRRCLSEAKVIEPEYLSQEKDYEARQIKEKEEERRKQQEYEARTGKRVLSYGFGGDYYKFEFRQGLRIILDSKFKVIGEYPVLIPFRGSKC